MNYYEILGIDSNASDKDIKKAFRNKAKEWHPDKFAGESDEKKKEAEEKFKEIQKAYEVLSDKDKKAMYDRFGEDGLRGGGMGQGGFYGEGSSVEDMMEDFLRDMGYHTHGRSTMRNGSNAGVNLRLTLKDMYYGIKGKEIKYHVKKVCPDCQGKGYRSEADLDVCPQCHGRGVFVKEMRSGGMTQIFQQVCPNCGGSGRIVRNPCPSCGGSGMTETEETIVVDIPRGVFDGLSLTMEGKGNYPQSGDPSRRGNLIIMIKAAQENGPFARDGHNLTTTSKINFVEALLGSEMKVETIDGKTLKIKIPPMSANGKLFKLSSKGMPIMGTNDYGALIVKLEYEMPRTLTGEQKELLEKLRKSFGEKENNA